MNNFWELVRFEYKKVFLKKSILITLILTMTVTVLGCTISIIANKSSYDNIKTDREYARALSGRELDKDLIMEASAAYAQIPSKTGKYNVTEEYQLYARAYSSIHSMLTIYDTADHNFELFDMQNITEKQASLYYDVRRAKIKQYVNQLNLNDHSKLKLLKLDEKVQKPFLMDYIGGYEEFIFMMYTTGITSAFIIAICLAPIFSGEYTRNTYQIAISTKNGKRTLIFAKLLIGFLTAIILCMILTLITYLSSMLIYGFDGFAAQYQILFPDCPYPLTMGKVSFIYFICVLSGCTFISSITMLLSAKFKTAFGVISIIIILIMLPMFLNIPENYDVLIKLINLLPTNMMAIWNITSLNLYEIFGLSIEPYIFIPIFVLLASTLFLFFAFRSFRNHQVD